MADCECLPKCPFFHDRMESKPATAQIMKTQYCLGDNSECARHMLFTSIGGANVPSDLYPSQTARVPELIKAFRQKA